MTPINDDVTRYAITHIGPNGVRVLTFGHGDNWTWPTAADAWHMLDEFIPALRAGFLGTAGVLTLAVVACKCSPETHEPRRQFFSADDIVPQEKIGVIVMKNADVCDLIERVLFLARRVATTPAEIDDCNRLEDFAVNELGED